VAHFLGNTPAICRKCYVHPAIVEAYLAGEEIAELSNTIKTPESIDLPQVERAIVEFLHARNAGRKQNLGSLLLTAIEGNRQRNKYSRLVH
jgi:DNA topoisomerase-1